MDLSSSFPNLLKTIVIRTASGFGRDWALQTEKAMAPHSSTLAWKIPWTEESGRLQSMGLLRVGHDWATSLSRTGEGNGNPLQCSCLENPRDGGAWWAAVYGVAQSRTWLKWLSSSRALQNGSPSLSNHLDPSASEQLATFSLRVKLRSQHMTQIDFNPNSMTACQVVEYRCNPFMSVLWVELCPAQNSHVEVPSPRILEYDCIEDRAFKR